MSIEVKVKDVVEVLLADGWHQIAADESLEIDEREYKGAQVERDYQGVRVRLATGVGFRFVEEIEDDHHVSWRATISGPLESVLATRTRTITLARSVEEKKEEVVSASEVPVPW